MCDRGASILLVEDVASDAELLCLALAKGGVQNPVDVVNDGQNALDYLNRQGVYVSNASDPLPCLIMLDLDLPMVGGLEVARRVKATERLKRIPIVILTSSLLAEDRMAAYDSGANSYLEKPSDLAQLEQLASLIREYWIVSNVPAELCA